MKPRASKHEFGENQGFHGLLPNHGGSWFSSKGGDAAPFPGGGGPFPQPFFFPLLPSFPLLIFFSGFSSEVGGGGAVEPEGDAPFFALLVTAFPPLLPFFPPGGVCPPILSACGNEIDFEISLEVMKSREKIDLTDSPMLAYEESLLSASNRSPILGGSAGPNFTEGGKYLLSPPPPDSGTNA